MGDMKIGMRVRRTGYRYEDKGREFIILDRAPGSGQWWLQDAETGAIGINLRESERNLSLVADDYRTKTDILELFDGTKLVVKFRAGRWAVCGTRVYYAREGERAKWLGEPFNIVRAPGIPWKVKITEAKRLASELNAVMPDYEAVADDAARLELVRSAILRAFGVDEAAA